MLDVFTRLRVGLVVPSIGHTSGVGENGDIFGIDVQGQRDDAVAAVDGGQRINEGACLRERGAVEVVAAVEADVLLDFGLQVRPDGQRHGGGAVAAIDVRVVVDEGIDACLGEQRVEAVQLVAVAGADLIGECDRAGRVDGEVQDHRAVAAVHRGHDARVGGVADFRGLHVEAVQTVILTQAERGVEFGGVQLVDDEVQHRGAWAAVLISALQLVVLRGRGILDVEAILRVGAAGADIRRDGVTRFRTHGQGQRHGAVAAVNRREGLGVGACGGQDISAEVETAVLADHLGDVLVIDRAHGQAQFGHAVATEDVLVVVVERVGAGLCEGGVKAVRRVGGTGAHLVVQHHVVRRVDRDVQVHRAVAAERGGEHLREGRVPDVGGDELEAVGIVRLALAERCSQVCGDVRVDVQVQHGGAVAAVHVRNSMLVVLTLSGFRNLEVVFVVVSAFADVRRDLAAFLGTHVQMQIDQAIAAVHGSQCCMVNTCLIERFAVEVVFAVEADGVEDVRLVNRIDGQVEDGETVATVNVQVAVGQRVFAGRVIDLVEAVERVGLILASHVREGHLAGRIHGDEQRDGAVASEDCLQVLRQCELAGLRGDEFEAVLLVDVTETKRCLKVGGGGLVDGQVQDSDAVATVFIGVALLKILALKCLCNFKSVFGVGSASADFGVKVFLLLRIDGKVQGNGAVAAVGGRQVGGVVAFVAELILVEHEGFACTDDFVKFRLENRQHGQMEDGGAVAAIGGLTFARQCLLTGFHEQFAEAVVRVFAADTNLVVQLHRDGLVDGQVHRDSAVAVL